MPSAVHERARPVVERLSFWHVLLAAQLANEDARSEGNEEGGLVGLPKVHYMEDHPFNSYLKCYD